MSVGYLPSRRLPFGAAVAAWYDHESGGRAVWIFLALFVAVWTSFQLIVYSAVGLDDDLAEVFVWSQHPSAGYQKHPPLTALVAWTWFKVFPVREWSFYLLAMVNAAVALFAVYLIARRYIKGDKRLLVLLLLLLTPFYQFHGQRFNNNAVLLSTWPIATYCFLRAFRSRGLAWSAVAGVMAALAMLGKYYSIYLVAGFAVAALWHPRRWDYLRSASPWVSSLCGLAVLSPHLYWLATMGPEPFRYALAAHGGTSVWGATGAALEYAAGALGYVLVPFAAYLAAVRPNRRQLAAALWPDDPDRRMLVVLLAAPLLLPMLTAPIIGVKLTSLWTMSAWFLLPIVLLGAPEITLTRVAAVRVALGLMALTAVILAAAPAVAWKNYLQESGHGRAYYRIASEELTRSWRMIMRRPLRIVSGDPALAQAASVYSPDHPDSAPDFATSSRPWITRDRWAREGWAALCFAHEHGCLDAAKRFSAGRAGVVRIRKTLAVSFFGLSGTLAKVVFIMAPPRQ